MGTGVPSDGKRDVPDVSLAADPNHDGYVLCTQETNAAGTAFTGQSSCAYPVGSNQVPYFDTSGSGYFYGGTSIAAPQWAAILTLMNQEAGNKGGVGNIESDSVSDGADHAGGLSRCHHGKQCGGVRRGKPELHFEWRRRIWRDVLLQRRDRI